MSQQSFKEDRLCRKDAASYLGLKNPNTLAVWATTRRYDLPYYKIGRLVYYRKSDLDAFIQRRGIGLAASA